MGLAALLVYTWSLAPELAPRAGAGTDLAFQATDPPWLQEALTRLDSVDGWSPSSVLARAWARLPAGANVNLLSAVLAALATALMTAHLVEVAGGLPGVCAALGFALSPVVWAAAVAGAGSAPALMLSVAVLVALRTFVIWNRARRAWILVVASGALVAATAQDLVVGVAATTLLVVALWRHGQGTWGSVRWGLGVLLLGAVWQGVALGSMLGGTVGQVEPPTTFAAGMAIWRWGADGASSTAGVLAERATALFATVTGSIGLLGWILASLGLRASISMLATLALLLCALVVGPVPGPWDAGTRPVLLLAPAWALIGLGLQRLAAWRLAGGRPVAMALGLLLPVLELARLPAQADALVDRPAGRMLVAFSRQQTETAAIVVADPAEGRLLRWANRRRAPAPPLTVLPNDPVRIEGLIRMGVQVLATEPAAARLSLSGITGPPVAVKGRPLDDLVDATDHRALVALALGPGMLDANPAVGATVARLMGPADARRHDRDAMVLLSRRSEELAHAVTGETEVGIVAAPGGASGLSPSLMPPEEVRLDTGPAGTRLDVAGREVAFIERGGVFASWSPVDGHLEWFPLDPHAGLTAPWRHDRWNLSRLERVAPCALVGAGGWSDVAGQTAAARVGLQLPAGADLRIYLGRDRGLYVRGAAFSGRPSPQVSVVAWDRANGEQARAASEAMMADGLEVPAGAAETRFVWQVVIRGPAVQSALVSMGLNGSPDWGWARQQPAAPRGPATICPGVAGARLFARDGQREDGISLNDADSYGDGWLGPSRSGSERWRETSAEESELLVRLDVPRTIDLTLSARPVAPQGVDPARIRLEVNGRLLEAQPLQAGPAHYAWTIPGDHWRTGTNRIVVRLTSAGRATPVGANPPRLQVTEVRLRR